MVDGVNEVRAAAMSRLHIARKKYTDEVVKTLWPRARQIVGEMASKSSLPIARDEHALNVLADCGLRAAFSQYVGSDVPGRLPVMVHNMLISGDRHPYWGDDMVARMVPYDFPGEAGYKQRQEYKLVLQAAAKTLGEYFALKNKESPGAEELKAAQIALDSLNF